MYHKACQCAEPVPRLQRAIWTPLHSPWHRAGTQGLCQEPVAAEMVRVELQRHRLGDAMVRSPSDRFHGIAGAVPRPLSKGQSLADEELWCRPTDKQLMVTSKLMLFGEELYLDAKRLAKVRSRTLLMTLSKLKELKS